MTPERRHYSKAPVTEALIDLTVTLAEDFSIDALEALGEAIADQYPTREPMYLYSGQISIKDVGDPMQAETAHQHGGFRFTDKDKQQVLQARLDGFTFSTFAPYDRWETLRDEARRLWRLYRSVVKAQSVTRAAVRYINRIDIPEAPIDLKDYLRTHPEVPDDMPHEGRGGSFFMQLQLWQEDLNCMLIVNEAPLSPLEQETTSIQLDFDLFREQFAEPWLADEDEAIWDFLEQLHDRKNEAFEASITNATRRLIDE